MQTGSEWVVNSFSLHDTLFIKVSLNYSGPCCAPIQGWKNHYNLGNESTTVQGRKRHVLIFLLLASTSLKHHYILKMENVQLQFNESLCCQKDINDLYGLHKSNVWPYLK